MPGNRYGNICQKVQDIIQVATFMLYLVIYPIILLTEKSVKYKKCTKWKVGEEIIRTRLHYWQTMIIQLMIVWSLPHFPIIHALEMTHVHHTHRRYRSRKNMMGLWQVVLNGSVNSIHLDSQEPDQAWWLFSDFVRKIVMNWLGTRDCIASYHWHVAKFASKSLSDCWAQKSDGSSKNEDLIQS